MSDDDTLRIEGLALSVRVLGHDPWTHVVDLHRRLAYVPGDVSLWPTMSGGEAIDLLGRLRGGSNQDRRAELIERFELDPTKRGRLCRPPMPTDRGWAGSAW